MKVAIIGSGYVGLITGLGLAELGHEVICVDKDQARVDSINRGEPPFFEPGLDDLMAARVGGGLSATSSLVDAVRQCDVSMVTVDTPFDGHGISLRSIEAVATAIGAALAAIDRYHVVVVKSTVVPGTTDNVVLPILEQGSAKRAGEDFGVGVNPEFLREGQAVQDFLDPDRLVFGGIDDRTIDVLSQLYEGFSGVDMVRTNTRTAEMIKYASNSLLATLISFSNEIANLSAEVGVNGRDVMRGVHLDKRLTPIGEDGERTWPGIISYLEPGCGFGGSCFPKDVRSLIAFGREHHSEMRILESVMEVNDAQPSKMLELLDAHFEDLAGRKITVLGLAFKPGTDDVRESPALTVARHLSEMDAKVTVYDPVANEKAESVLGDRVAYAASLDDAVDESEAILLVTPWSEFGRLPAMLFGISPQPLVVDGRGYLRGHQIQRYESIGG